MTNAEIILEYRKKHGLSQKDFAERFGASESTVKAWEKGRVNAPEYFVRLLGENAELELQLESLKQKNRDLDAFIRVSRYYEAIVESRKAEKEEDGR